MHKDYYLVRDDIKLNAEEEGCCFFNSSRTHLRDAVIEYDFSILFGTDL